MVLPSNVSGQHRDHVTFFHLPRTALCSEQRACGELHFGLRDSCFVHFRFRANRTSHTLVDTCMPLSWNRVAQLDVACVRREQNCPSVRLPFRQVPHNRKTVGFVICPSPANTIISLQQSFGSLLHAIVRCTLSPSIFGSVLRLKFSSQWILP